MRWLALLLVSSLGCADDTPRGADTSPPDPKDTADATEDAPDDTEPDRDAALDVPETTLPPDTSDCHTDCFGGATCVDGVVHRLGYGPKPCSLGPGCEVGETYTCKTGCRTFTAPEDYPDPYDPDLPLSEYCEGEHILPVADWLAPCEASTTGGTSIGASESEACVGGLCYYEVLDGCVLTGCTQRCVRDLGCPEGGRCQGDYCVPRSPSCPARRE